MVPRVTVATLWIVCTQCTYSHSVHSARAPLPCCTSCPLLTLLCMQLDLKDVSYMLYVAASRFRTGHGLSMLHSVPSIIRAYACEASRSPATNDSTHGLLGCTTLRCIERACPTTQTHSSLQFQRSHRQTHHTCSAAPAPPRLSRSSSSGWCPSPSVLPLLRPTLTALRGNTTVLHETDGLTTITPRTRITAHWRTGRPTSVRTLLIRRLRRVASPRLRRRRGSRYY